MKLPQKQIVQRIPQNSDVSPLLSSPELLKRVYINRGVKSDDDVNYTTHRLIPPEKFKNINSSVELLSDAVMHQKKIIIVGDFDADGATGTAVAIRCLKGMGHSNISYKVPNRFQHGYGLSSNLVKEIIAESPDLIITVDNGISSVEGVKIAQDNDIAVLITDHHLPGKVLPAADAILNPNVLISEFPSRNLAGVGVVYYLMIALRKYLREKKWFYKNDLKEPNMGDFLDLVALGTIADLVPLDFNNRVLVEQGLRRIREGRCNKAILTLLALGNRIYSNVVASDLGFIVAPRINAAGRLDDISVGIECLVSDDVAKVEEFASQLDILNVTRKKMQKNMQSQARQILDETNIDSVQTSAICIYDERWNQGIVGILASSIKEKYNVPVIAFADFDDEKVKGSGRSVQGVHIRDAIARVSAKKDELIEKFGGHAMAAGLTIKKNNLKQFEKELNNAIAEMWPLRETADVIKTDGSLQDSEFSMQNAQLLRFSGPWGQGFEEPCFDNIFQLVSHKYLGDEHLKIRVSTTTNDKLEFDAIVFNYKRYNWLENIEFVHLVYHIEVNKFQGRETLQLRVIYLEPSAG
jgi:single-stranded-DNA-specific exonuclease